jgi:hemolysin D
LHPDIALVDIEMPEMSGLEVTHHISQQYPETKVLVLSIHDDDDYIRKALQAGARGYLLKNTPPDELAHAIRFVRRGYLQLGPGLFEKLESHHSLNLSEATETDLNQPERLLPSTMTPVLATPAILNTHPIEPDWEDWTAQTQDMVNHLPRLWSRGLLYVIVMFTIVILPWSLFAEIEEMGVSRGRLEPKGKVIRLDTQVGGTVAKIYVQEGDRIRKGQPLMALQTEFVKADLQQEQAKLTGLLNRQTQLAAIKAQLDTGLDAAQQQLRAQTAAQLAEIQKVAQQQTAAQESQQLARALIQKDQAKIANLSRLSSQGAIPRTQVEEAERTLIQNQQQLQKHLADDRQSGAELKKQESAYQKLLSDEKIALLEKQKQIRETLSQATDVKSQVVQSQFRLKSLQLQQQQRTISAPTAGVLYQLPIQHPGAVLKAGDLVAQIAPASAKLVLRAKLETKDSGFIRPGLPAKLKFDAYPFQDYGIVPGQLSWISPNSIENTIENTIRSNSAPNRKVDVAGGYQFDVEIDLAKSSINTQNRQILLQAGQSATAEIVVRKRKVIEILLQPFRQLQRSSL